MRAATGAHFCCFAYARAVSALARAIDVTACTSKVTNRLVPYLWAKLLSRAAGFLSRLFRCLGSAETEDQPSAAFNSKWTRGSSVLSFQGSSLANAATLI